MRFLTLLWTDFVSHPSRQTLGLASFSTGINEQWSGHYSLRLTTHRLDLIVLTVSDMFSSLPLTVMLHPSSSFPHSPQQHLQQLIQGVMYVCSEKMGTAAGSLCLSQSQQTCHSSPPVNAGNYVIHHQPQE